MKQWQRWMLLPGVLSGSLVLPSSAAFAAEFEYTGSIATELRAFTEEAQHTGQSQDSNLSLSFEPILYWQWNDGGDLLSFKPFLRIDQHDDERTHADIRELSWIHLGDNWELRAGLRKVFWGVTEFQHLVDVINQSDGVEDIDGEDKLGQPMVNLSLVRDWGIVDLYLLPGFRERTFPGSEGRLRSALVVDTDQASFEAGNEERHTDVAVRWSHSVDAFDLGAYWFRGTNRDPVLKLGSKNGSPVLTPHYEQMNQVGFDLQATLDSWLWKAEAIWRDSDSDTYWASQTGFEYTFYGVTEAGADLGVLLEYGWDQRGLQATSIFQNDISVGMRLTLNDEDSTELLAGMIHDMDYHTTSFQMEASRRIGQHWKLSGDLRYFASRDQRDPIQALNKDSHVQLTLTRYF